MITKKHSIIIKELNEKNEYVTAAELSEKVGVSVRTIKRYIKDLNYFLKEKGVVISSIKGVGYKFSGSAKEIKKIVEEAEGYIEGFKFDDSLEGRISSAICIMLNKEYISVEELSNELNLSVPSTNKLICNIKQMLERYNLKLVSKPHYGTKIEGKEISIRSLILDYAIKIDEKGKMKIGLLNIKNSELKFIEEIIASQLKQNNIIISDKDFSILLSRIIASISRSKLGNKIGAELFQSQYRLHNYNLVQSIMNDISKKLNIEINENEILYVSNYSGVIIYDYNAKKQLNENQKIIFEAFVKDCLKEIYLISGNNYSEDEEFINALSMHLIIFMKRINAGVNSKNPLLQQIKANFPVEFNLATLLANRIHEKFNIILDEDEIGFVAMHFAAASERINVKCGKKICIICHYGIGTSQLLCEKLKKRISDIDVVGIYPARYLDVALKQDIDFIVSTVEIDNKDSKVKVPILYIENVFSDSIFESIIDELNEAFNEGEERRKILKDMFDERAFFKINAKSKEEAIKKLGISMKANELIDDTVIQKVLEREKISATDIGHLVAIPHTIMEGTYKSVIGVGILEKPILWDKEEVQLIFMICFNIKQQHNFPVFKYLYNFIEDEGGVKGVIKFCDFNKLMKILDVK